MRCARDGERISLIVKEMPAAEVNFRVPCIETK